MSVAQGARHDSLQAASNNIVEAASSTAEGSLGARAIRIRNAARAFFQVIEAHQHVAEDAGGTLPAATQRKPGLMSAADRLEHEHRDMLHRAAEIEVECERQLAAQDYDLEMIRLQAVVLRDILRLHVFRTDELIHDAYVRVEGGESG